MRITNSMMVANTVRNINKSMERLSKAQQQVSSQSKIQLPSDDPTVAARAVKYRNYVAKVKQYQQNVQSAASWQEVTDNALSELNDVIARLKELTTQAASDTLSDSDRESIKTEVSQLQEQVVDIMNTSYAGRYIFGGYATDEPPYALELTDVGAKVIFKAQYLSLGGPVSATVSDDDIISFCTDNAGKMYESSGWQEIKYNIGFGSKIAINVEGQDVTGQGLGNNLFDTIDKLLLGLAGETSYKTAEITGHPATVTVQTESFTLDELLTDLENDLDRVLAIRADLGARMNYVSKVSDRLSDQYTTYTTLMSNNEDVDLEQAYIDLTTAEYVYEASLTVGTQAISKTLLDYLA